MANSDKVNEISVSKVANRIDGNRARVQPNNSDSHKVELDTKEDYKLESIERLTVTSTPSPVSSPSSLSSPTATPTSLENNINIDDGSESVSNKSTFTSNNTVTNNGYTEVEIISSNDDNKTSNNKDTTVSSNTNVNITESLNGNFTNSSTGITNMGTNNVSSITYGSGSSSIDNQTTNDINSLKKENGSIVVIASIGIVAIVAIICAAYFLIKRKRKTEKVIMEDEEDMEDFTANFNNTLSKSLSKSSGDEKPKFEYNTHPADYSLSSSEDIVPPVHPLPPLPSQEVMEQEASYSKYVVTESQLQNDAGSSYNQVYYPNNQYAVNSGIQDASNPYQAVSPQYQAQVQAQYGANPQYQVSNQPLQSVSQEDQYVDESIDQEAANEASPPKYDFEAMDEQTLTQSSKYLNESVDKNNVSLASKSIFDSVEHQVLSQSNQYLLSQSIFETGENPSSQSHAFDPNNSSIDIYATEAVISFSEEIMEAVDSKFPRS